MDDLGQAEGAASETALLLAVDAVGRLVQAARQRLRERVLEAGKPSAERLDQHQLALHALATLASEHAAARELAAWSARTGGELEGRMARAYAGELVRATAGGIVLGPCESIGTDELGLSASEVGALLGTPELAAFSREACSGEALCALAASAHERGSFGDPGYVADDGTLAAVRESMRTFVEREVIPIAQEVHLRDLLIPIDLIGRLAALGVFATTLPEAYGGQGLGRVVGCVVTEELSRGSLAVGSLGTRSEIAAELVLTGGTEEQKRRLLPRIATGELLPTAVFTEPDHGSDLAHVRTRAERRPGGGFALFGQKSWITHAARADLMTVLARTDPSKPGYEGLSMFLAEKRRAAPVGDFPDEGITGSEIKVIGYRGMKEYELGFDGFEVGADALLGGREGQGFKQLMATFEHARIQTAARSVGVAQAALEQAMRYAHERVQFGVPIASFPRVARKLGRMLVTVMAARQLTWFAARTKDSGVRCDLEAGMAKLLAARVAWEAADACVQIHGGSGYAEESLASRLLVDARVLSLFEGASEIQAQVIGRRLVE